jgi:CBS domain-containing protein
MANSQTDVFHRLVSDSLGTPPPSAPLPLSIGEAVDCVRETRASGLVLLDEDGCPAGLLTETDIARRVTFSADATAPVTDFMTAPVITAAHDEYLYLAIARMRKNGLRHLPVVDGAGRLAGILHLDDALAGAAEDLVERIDLLSEEGGEAALHAVKRAQIAIAADLLADNVPVADVQGLITYVNNDLYRRVMDGVLAEMPGPPPVPFALIVMGSGGRGENFLSPDQDNGLILADYPDEDHDRIDAWFLEFADRLTIGMDAIGLPLCTGNVMATNPLWRKTQSQWHEQIGLWVRRRGMAALLLADIFFDFVPVAGDTSMAVPVRERITDLMADAPLFLNGMQKQHDSMRSALGLFGRFRTEPGGSEHAGKIDIKHAAVQPAVAAARLLALKDGIPATGTLDRVRALAEQQVIAPDDAEEICAAFGTVCDILLRSQIAAVEAGEPVTNYVAPAALRRSQKRDLKAGLRVIENFAARARAEFTGGTL